MINTFTLRKLIDKDAKMIANVHHKVFKNFFLTSLGVNFLESFYEAVLRNEGGLGIGAFVDNKIIGFAIGTKKTGGFYSSIVKTRGIRLFFDAFSRLIFHPARIIRLMASLKGSGNNEYAKCPSLLSICVDNESGIKGVGSSLINAFENELIDMKYKDVILTTDTIDNDYVNEFYRRNNYICINSFLSGKREMNFYHKKLKI